MDRQYMTRCDKVALFKDATNTAQQLSISVTGHVVFLVTALEQFQYETPESSNHVDGRWKTVAVSCRAPHAMQLECRRDNGMKVGASDDRRDPCQQLKILTCSQKTPYVHKYLSRSQKSHMYTSSPFKATRDSTRGA